MKKVEEISKLTVSELRERYSKYAQDYFELKMQKCLGQLKSPSEIRKLKRDIARVKCILMQKLVQKSN